MEEQSILASKAYKRAKTNLKDKLKSTFLKHYPHHLSPGYNLHANFSVDNSDAENVIEQYQDYPYHCDLPRPLLPPAKLPRSVLNEEDPALELLTIKSHLKDSVQRMKQYYCKHDKDLGLVSKKDIKWDRKGSMVTAKVPKYVTDLAEMIDADPDPHFQGSYNWYYTGGSLDCLQLDDMNVFLFPFMGELVATPIINVDELLWRPQLQMATKLELDGSLLELRHNSRLILGRYKDHCNFYMLSRSDHKISLFEMHKQCSKVPYVSADLSPINTNYYCTANVSRSVTLWDINKMKYVSANTIMQNKVLDDSWSTVRFWSTDPNVILFLDRCCLHYLDVRNPFDRPALTLCPKSYLEKCEDISLDIASRHSFCRYIATSHSVLMCDNRSPKQCVQQKWTHQFKSPPLMGNTINREDKEFVILSSQVAGESTVILNTWTSNETLHSFNFPFTPPPVMKTLNEAQMQGMCLNPYLRDRLELCNIGFTVIKNDADNLFLFLQNSIGDVFYQCVTYDTALNKYSSINCKSYCILKDWQNAISLQTDTIVPLSVSEKTSMQHIYENFTNRKLRLKYNKQNPDYDPSWKQPLDQLNSYVDILAPELLALWEICEEVPLPLTAAPHQKVLNWLESTETKPMVPSQEELDNVATPINTQELMSVSQEIDLTYLDDSNALQELLLPKVKTTKKKSNQRKKQKI